MKRSIPIIPTLIVLAAAAIMIRLGFWQLDRLHQKEAMLARMRRHLRLKGWLQVWLYVHVPMTFALIAALSAHIVSVFFYW